MQCYVVFLEGLRSEIGSSFPFHKEHERSVLLLLGAKQSMQKWGAFVCSTIEAS
jgi:hypothetical protein